MKKKIYYVTPILGIAFCILIYMLLRKKSMATLGETILQAVIALAIYYVVAFFVSYVCMPTKMKCEEKKEFPFSFLPAKSDNNLLFAFVKFIGVFASPDYVMSQFMQTSLDGKGIRKYNRREMYFNLLISIVIVAIAYLLSVLKAYYLWKVFTILILIRMISRGVQIIVNCFTFMFDKEYRSNFKSTFMPEYAITTLLELFFLFFYLYIIFNGGLVGALYCALRIFTLVPQFISGIKWRSQFLMVIQSVFALVLVISSIANYILMSREEKDNK